MYKKDFSPSFFSFFNSLTIYIRFEVLFMSEVFAVYAQSYPQLGAQCYQGSVEKSVFIHTSSREKSWLVACLAKFLETEA